MKETILILDYGAGNLLSVAKATMAASDLVGKSVTVTTGNRPVDIRKADRIILPGVGAFGACATALNAVPDLVPALREHILEKAYPFLGICVGMQLLLTHGHEHGTHKGLGWIEGEVVRLNPCDKNLRIPHTGWSEVHLTHSGKDHGLARQMKTGGDFYYVHSYHAKPQKESCMLAYSTHGEKIAAVIGKDTLIGTQFHPEKSQKAGLEFLSFFLAWTPEVCIIS